MSINFNVTSVKVTPINAYDMDVEIEGFKTSDIVTNLEEKEVLDCFTTMDVLNHFDHYEILEQMDDIELIKSFLNDKGIEV